MPTLLSFKTRDGRIIDICVEIGDDSKAFGILLLNDPTGHLVDDLTENEVRPARKNLALLKHWLRDKRSWSDLISFLRKYKCNMLATDIENSIKAGIKQGDT